MNRLEIRNRIRRALNDEDGVYWSAEDIHDLIQDGMEMLAEEAPAIKRTFTVPRRAGTMVYHLEGTGEDIQTPYRVYLPDLNRRLHSWSITDLDGRHEIWMTVTGDPYVWFPVDWNQFGIWPVPASAGGTMQVSCYAWPMALLEDNDRPEFMPADHEALVTYGEFQGFLKQRDPARAIQRFVQFANRWRDASGRHSVKQMQSAFHVRDRTDGYSEG